MSQEYGVSHMPDVLTCLTDLSNDEVFTPPDVANAMLDLLPEEIWSRDDVKFLDPACKTGVFLREITKRLLRGQMPDFDRRMSEIDNKRQRGEKLNSREEHYVDLLQATLDHILKEQVYGIAITQMTALMTRRTLYCAKDATSEFSVVQFDNSEGNIRFVPTEHEWEGKDGSEHCKWCGVAKSEIENRSSQEIHAYEIIHTTHPERLFDVEFDVIVSNPPYQLGDGGNKASSIPIYHKFVEQARKFEPHYMSMIIPARWYAGGKGLDNFRADMLNDEHIAKLIDYVDSQECFESGVDIAGGVCYFLWDAEATGHECYIEERKNGTVEHSTRTLNEFSTFIRDKNALSIIHKVRSKNEKTMDEQISARKPFGLATNVLPLDHGDISLRYIKGTGPYSRDLIKTGTDMIDKWKVVASYVSFDHAGRADKDGKRRVLSTMYILPPGTICTETYLVYGAYDTEEEAKNLQHFMTLFLPRFLIAQLSSGQHLTRQKFAFCPIPDVNVKWTDEMLYEKYGLDEDEIAAVESTIRNFVLSE